MVQVSPQLLRVEKQPWFITPSSDHLVHIYRHERVLVACLLEYVLVGLWRRETCVVIATPPVLIGLQKGLRLRGIDVARALQAGRYATYDADGLLATFMDKYTVDVDAFDERVGGIVRQYIDMGRPIRLYGEMVAQLLAGANLHAALEVERLWNKLLRRRDASLYCAYPDSLISPRSWGSERRDAIMALHAHHLCS